MVAVSPGIVQALLKRSGIPNSTPNVTSTGSRPLLETMSGPQATGIGGDPLSQEAIQALYAQDAGKRFRDNLSSGISETTRAPENVHTKISDPKDGRIEPQRPGETLDDTEQFTRELASEGYLKALEIETKQVMKENPQLGYQQAERMAAENLDVRGYDAPAQEIIEKVTPEFRATETKAQKEARFLSNVKRNKEKNLDESQPLETRTNAEADRERPAQNPLPRLEKGTPERPNTRANIEKQDEALARLYDDPKAGSGAPIEDSIFANDDALGLVDEGFPQEQAATISAVNQRLSEGNGVAPGTERDVATSVIRERDFNERANRFAQDVATRFNTLLRGPQRQKADRGTSFIEDDLFNSNTANTPTTDGFSTVGKDFEDGIHGHWRNFSKNAEILRDTSNPKAARIAAAKEIEKEEAWLTATVDRDIPPKSANAAVRGQKLQETLLAPEERAARQSSIDAGIVDPTDQPVAGDKGYGLDSIEFSGERPPRTRAVEQEAVQSDVDVLLKALREMLSKDAPMQRIASAPISATHPNQAKLQELSQTRMTGDQSLQAVIRELQTRGQA